MRSRKVKEKKKKIRKSIKVVFVIGMICLLSGISLQFYSFSTAAKKESFGEKDKVKEVITVVEQEQVYNASLVMVGDALIHSSIYADAKGSNNTYNFVPMLEYIKPIVSNYDLAYYNQETILGGKELGLSNYPRFNSPYEVGDAFIDAGFNLVSLATNHTMDKNEQGVLNSLNYWNSKKDVYTAGSYLSFDDRDSVVYREKNGIKYALLSYTTWTNGLSTPKGKEYLNNVYSDELAKNDIERIRDKVDVIIVAMHWGNEYSMGVSQNQTQIANYLSSLGVDIIVGAHPHVVEPIEYINDGKTLVIYSLGNFISDQVGIDRLTGLMVSMNIKKMSFKGKTTIDIESLKAELLYTKSSSYGKRNFKVYPYSQLNNTILPNYKSYYEKYKGVITSRMPELEVSAISEG